MLRINVDAAMKKILMKTLLGILRLRGQSKANLKGIIIVQAGSRQDSSSRIERVIIETSW